MYVTLIVFQASIFFDSCWLQSIFILLDLNEYALSLLLPNNCFCFCYPLGHLYYSFNLLRALV